jgi:Fic family protein
MNCYYSNLIEGHNTRPRDIERSLADDWEKGERRNLQLEARAHIRVQSAVDQRFASGELGEPTDLECIRWLHAEFYKDAPVSALRIRSKRGHFTMVPGEFRRRKGQDNIVGRHQPPSSVEVPAFMAYFAERFHLVGLGQGAQLVTTAIAHHRFNFIHPFPDGNGRVSRLLSHAMLHVAGVGAQGLWSISRGLARGLSDRSEYKSQMDAADAPRQGDLDGRGNLSLRALEQFVLWFCRVAADQLQFMGQLFDLTTLGDRLTRYIERDLGQREEAARLGRALLLRGELPRGEVASVTGLKERTARTVLNDLIAAGLVDSESPKGPIALRFNVTSADVLFPRLFGPAE